ncbi:hypothetical protein SLNWT_0928 [Streptomyces albus]|uniref:Uncharacterized protein n=1 Tax=Streptomyces albus (strain ATCC 21838 / DSM 41398 / FERM P-419 / JCM 4703 / NBRC 107858) TaxID=1081613 RepID=A0A0B5EIK9_STRA4|nr:hypothetical protein SLNWT_0928 [Streptomyces albus]AOU75619.1 hypothetical protein SLNHY_0928 [Streptomyces albus]
MIRSAQPMVALEWRSGAGLRREAARSRVPGPGAVATGCLSTGVTHLGAD